MLNGLKTTFYLFSCLMLYASSAFAFTATNNLGVSVVVPPTVVLSASALNFGSTYNPQTILQASAVITVNMVATQAYNITLDAGLNKLTDRRLSDGVGHFRNYLLYKDAARTQFWGDAGFSATYLSGSSLATVGTGNNQIFTVYGLAPSATNITSPPGNYTDTVTITVHY